MRFALVALAACAQPATDAADLDVTQSKIDQARAHIAKIFVVVKENRTFDHYFGDFPGAVRSLVARTANGPMPLTAKSGAMSAEGHTHAEAVTAWNGGRMNGWLSLSNDADRLSYYPGEAAGDPTYPYHQLAKGFALLDHFHTEMLGPSTPNHIAVVSGLAQVYDNCTGCTIGCEGSPIGVAPIVTPAPQCTTTTALACFGAQSVVELLDGVSWRGYGGVDGGGHIQSPLLNFQNTYQQIITSNPLRADTDLLADAEAGDIAQVTFVDYIEASCDATGNIGSGDKCSEEPGADPCYGENWTMNLIDAIAGADGGNTWYDTNTRKGVVILVTWDDWGGVFDHVAPPVVCSSYSQGLRVPMLVISPFAKTGVITTQASFGAIPRLIEDVFASSTRLGGDSRDVSDGDLLTAFDFTQPPKAKPSTIRGTCN